MFTPIAAVPTAQSTTQTTTQTTQATPALAGSTTHVNNPYSTTFGMPSPIHLPQFDSSEWNHRYRTIKAILTLHEAEDVFRLTASPTSIDTVRARSVGTS